MDANYMDPTIRNSFVSTASGYSSTFTSSPVRMMGNAVTMSTTVINISASSTFTVYLDGSFDGVSWKTITNYTQNSFGYNSSTQTALSYAFLRIRIELTGTTVSCLSSHSLTFASL